MCDKLIIDEMKIGEEMEYCLQTQNAQETIQFAKKLATKLKPGDLLLLEGDLGAGKTTFTKGIAEGLGITQLIKSPTYTIMREYQSGNLPLYHLDVYRLEETGSSDDLGIEEYIEGNGVAVVEWAQFIAAILPPNYLKITIKRVSDDVRDICLEPVGIRYEVLCSEVLK